MGYIVGAIFIVLGAVFTFIKIPPNPLAGARLPWTYADEEIWYKTNRLAGIMMLIWGALFLCTGSNNQQILIFIFAGLIPFTLVSLIYPMCLYYRKHKTLKTARNKRHV